MKVSKAPDEANRALTKLLPDEKVEAVKRIVAERAKHCLMGYALGCAVAYVVCSRMNADPWKCKCGFLAIMLSVCVLVYNWLPKSDWILNHLSGRDEIDAWLDMYKTCKYTYLEGVIVGLAVYGGYVYMQ